MIRLHFSEGPRVVEFVETESRQWFPEPGGVNGRLWCSGYRVSFLQDEKSFGDWLYTMCIYLTGLKRTHKMVHVTHFVVCIFPQLKKYLQGFENVYP